MANINTTLNDDILPTLQIRLAAKLHKLGRPIEEISSLLKVSQSSVLQLLTHFPHDKQIVTSFTQKSSKFRCSISKRLMSFPVIAPDNCLYEQRVLESSMNSGDCQGFNREQVLPVNVLKEEIKVFCETTLQQLEVSLYHPSAPDEITSIAAECLSVLIYEEECKSFLRVAKASTTCLKAIIEKLKDLVLDEGLAQLMTQLARHQGLHLPTIILAKAVLQGKYQQSEAFQIAFSCFVNALIQADLNFEAIDLADEISSVLCADQLIQMITALRLHGNNQVALLKADEFTIGLAHLRLNEGEKKEAQMLLAPLYGRPELKEKLDEFFRKSDWKSEQLRYLKSCFSLSLVPLVELPSVVASLNALHNLFSLKLEVASDSCQKSINTHSQAYLSLLLEAENQADLKLSSEIQRLDSAIEALVKEGQSAKQHTNTSIARFNRQLRSIDSKLSHVNQVSSMDSLVSAAEQENMQVNDSDVVDQVYIYSYKYSSDEFYQTLMSSGEVICHRLSSHTFKRGCVFTELPSGTIFVTGGGSPSCTDTFTIDFADIKFTSMPPMAEARSYHGAVFYSSYVFALGGNMDGRCEYYDCKEGRWHYIKPLPRACEYTTAVVLEDVKSLYVIGGGRPSGIKSIFSDLACIQRLNLETHRWTELTTTLPSYARHVACFKVSQCKLYLVVRQVLYVYCPLNDTLTLVKYLPQDIQSFCGPSYYINRTLYCARYYGPAQRLDIGSLY